MTHDSTHLRSLSPPSASLFVNTADGTSHSVLSHGTLHSPHFHVPSVSHVPNLKLQCCQPVRSLIMIVVSFLSLTLVLFRIVVWGPWLVLAAGSVILLVFGSSTG